MLDDLAIYPESASDTRDRLDCPSVADQDSLHKGQHHQMGRILAFTQSSRSFYLRQALIICFLFSSSDKPVPLRRPTHGEQRRHPRKECLYLDS